MKVFHKHNQFTKGWFNAVKHYGCDIVETKRTLGLKTAEGKHIAAQDHLSGYELSIINAVQKDVAAWYEEKKDTIDFISFSNKKVYYKGLHLNTLKRNFDTIVHCFDLKSAYPTLMFNEKMISQKTWDKLYEVKKEHKLWIVGSIATTQYRTSYLNGLEIAHEVRVKTTKIVWDYVVYKLDSFMRKLFSEYRSFYNYNYFSLAYYVDCLFILCDSPDTMEVFIKEFSEIVFKQGFTYGYSMLKLLNFDLFTKKIRIGHDLERSKLYCMTENGYVHQSKLVNGN